MQRVEALAHLRHGLTAWGPKSAACAQWALDELAAAEQRIEGLIKCQRCWGRGWIERQMQTKIMDVLFAQSVGFEMPENEREKVDCSCVVSVRVDQKVAELEARIAEKDAALDRIVEHCQAYIVNVVAVENVAKEGREK